MKIDISVIENLLNESKNDLDFYEMTSDLTNEEVEYLEELDEEEYEEEDSSS